ncbi:hypothetical protein ACOZ4I_17595 (plasmid) [Haloarcula salina]|uniref:hypothetical protein n=1 Tax=Haloarcula salina TaxID=1429914 RepID=UPI003C6F0A59
MIADLSSAQKVGISWKSRQKVGYVDTAFLGGETYILHEPDAERNENEGLLLFNEEGLRKRIPFRSGAFPADLHSLATFDEEILIVGENTKSEPVITSTTSGEEINWQTQSSLEPYMQWVCANLANEQIILVGLEQGTATSKAKIAGIDRQSGEINWEVDAFTNDFFAESIHSYEDGCILAGTSSTSEGDSWVARISSTGDVLWKQFYDDQEYVNFSSITVTNQGKIVFLGSDRESKTAYKLLTLDSEGQTISNQKESFPDESGSSLSLFGNDPEGGYIVVSGQISSSLSVGNVDTSGRLQNLYKYSIWNDSFNPQAVHVLSNQIRVIGYFVSPNDSYTGVVSIPRPLTGAETKTPIQTLTQNKSATALQNANRTTVPTTKPSPPETTDGSGPGLGLLTGITTSGIVAAYSVLKKKNDTEK